MNFCLKRKEIASFKCHFCQNDLSGPKQFWDQIWLFIAHNENQLKLLSSELDSKIIWTRVHNLVNFSQSGAEFRDLNPSFRCSVLHCFGLQQYRKWTAYDHIYAQFHERSNFNKFRRRLIEENPKKKTKKETFLELLPKLVDPKLSPAAAMSIKVWIHHPWPTTSTCSQAKFQTILSQMTNFGWAFSNFSIIIEVQFQNVLARVMFGGHQQPHHYNVVGFRQRWQPFLTTETCSD